MPNERKRFFFPIFGKIMNTDSGDHEHRQYPGTNVVIIQLVRNLNINERHAFEALFFFARNYTNRGDILNVVLLIFQAHILYVYSI